MFSALRQRQILLALLLPSCGAHKHTHSRSGKFENECDSRFCRHWSFDTATGLGGEPSRYGVVWQLSSTRWRPISTPDNFSFIKFSLSFWRLWKMSWTCRPEKPSPSLHWKKIMELNEWLIIFKPSGESFQSHESGTVFSGRLLSEMCFFEVRWVDGCVFHFE